jgi:hypothetical protein
MKVLGLGSSFSGGTVKRIARDIVEVVDGKGTKVVLTFAQVEKMLFKGE